MYFFASEGPESDSREGPVGRSTPSVRSPHHLAAEGIEENMIEPFHYFYTVVCPANGQLSRLLARFAAAVDGNEELWLRLSTSSVISQSSRMTIGRTLRLCGATGVMAIVLE